ncbi:unnamed protein product [Paramecium pentaurelia]|uniref:Uncharacterized protein n=1 Tax=Paramecium pentaurelia TaxID=43138 RepID=A0A8S1XSW1_9CILI|nr:unnamed protein product [Paramecium pentaurelia]
MQKLQQKQSIEQQIYMKSRLIHNLQNYLLCNQQQKECQIKNNPQDADIFLKQQYQLKLHGLYNKPLRSLVVLHKNQIKK